MAARVLLEHGIDAWASDLPDAGAYWHASDAPTDRFVHADAAAARGLPFADGAFDVVLSLGVIEHIGTVHGHCSLRPDYRQVRARFATYCREEPVRITAAAAAGLVLALATAGCAATTPSVAPSGPPSPATSTGPA